MTEGKSTSAQEKAQMLFQAGGFGYNVTASADSARSVPGSNSAKSSAKPKKRGSDMASKPESDKANARELFSSDESHERRDRRVVVLCKQSEFERWKGAAEDVGVPLSTYVYTVVNDFTDKLLDSDD